VPRRTFVLYCKFKLRDSNRTIGRRAGEQRGVPFRCTYVVQYLTNGPQQPVTWIGLHSPCQMSVPLVAAVTCSPTSCHWRRVGATVQSTSTCGTCLPSASARAQCPIINAHTTVHLL
jgi:hypothetical protein